MLCGRRESIGKDERIKKLSSIQFAAYKAVKAMDQYAGIDDATVSQALGIILVCFNTYCRTTVSFLEDSRGHFFVISNAGMYAAGGARRPGHN